MSTVIHETPKTIAYAKVVANHYCPSYVEVEYLNRGCTWLLVYRIWADGAESVRSRCNSQKTRLPKDVRAAAIKLLGA